MKELIRLNGEKDLNGIKIKIIEGGFGEGNKAILFSDVALKHNVEPKSINQLIKRNKNRYTDDDLIDLCDENFKVYAKNLGLITSNGQKHCYILSETGYIKLVDTMKDKNIKIAKDILTEYFGTKEDFIILSARKEINFLEALEKGLEPFNIKGIRQYNIDKYRIDYYIPSLNIAIEYDENGHANYTYEEHEGRQKYIENKLGCRFIRITDNNSDEYNIGLVIKELFNITVVS